MSTPPRPGRVVRFLMERRLTASQRAQLHSELGELHEHRVAREGRAAADRWLRREHRRWGWRLLVHTPAGGELRVEDTVRQGPAAGPGLSADLRHSARGLARTPLFTAAVVLTVGLGIGGTTLVYGVVHSVLMAPLPYPGSERMVLLQTVRGEDAWGTSMADLEAIYDAPPAFEAIASYMYRNVPVAFGPDVELLRTKWVTDNYFPLLGIAPVLGRAFTPEEGRAGGANAFLVTLSFFESVLGGDPDALGRAFSVAGEPSTLVGVLPDRLGPLDELDVFPVLRVETPPRKGPFFLITVARLAAGVEAPVARAQLAQVSERIYPVWEQSFPTPDATLSFRDLKEILVGDVTRTLWMVFAAVAFLLLIATANAASLLVARGVSRQREVSIRTALGASGGRILRLLLSEAAILATGGAVVALVLVTVGVDVVRRMGFGRLPRAEELSVSPAALTFMVAVTLASWALFGFVASISVLRRRTADVASSGRAGPSLGARRARRALVGAQFAVSVPLLVGAGLLARSLDRLQHEDLGFDARNLVSMTVSLPATTYGSDDAVRRFWYDVLPELEALPAVERAGLSDARPPVRFSSSNNFVLEDQPSGRDAPQQQSTWITADPGYFATLGIGLLEGRLFDDPVADTMRTAVVDEAWAGRYSPGRSPLGLRFRSGGCTVDGCPFIEIVGVVANVKTTGLDDPMAGSIYYDFRRDTYGDIGLHVRTRGEPLAAVDAIRRVLREYDPTVPVADVMTAEDVASESIQGRRYTGLLVGLLAGVALLLSLTGIYGAMSYWVRQHTREIGIRLALGGDPGSARRLVVRQGMVVAIAGTAVGLLATLGLTRWMAGLLYRVSPTDPLVFGSVVALTLGVALAANAIPARHAAATDPATALRED